MQEQIAGTVVGELRHVRTSDFGAMHWSTRARVQGRTLRSLDPSRAGSGPSHIRVQKRATARSIVEGQIGGCRRPLHNRVLAMTDDSWVFSRGGGGGEYVHMRTCARLMPRRYGDGGGGGERGGEEEAAVYSYVHFMDADEPVCAGAHVLVLLTRVQLSAVETTPNKSKPPAAVKRASITPSKSPYKNDSFVADDGDGEDSDGAGESEMMLNVGKSDTDSSGECAAGGSRAHE